MQQDPGLSGVAPVVSQSVLHSCPLPATVYPARKRRAKCLDFCANIKVLEAITSEDLKSAKGRVSAPPYKAETREIVAARPWPVLRELLKSAKGRVSAPPYKAETREIVAARPWPVLRELLRSAKGRASAPPYKAEIREIVAARPWPRFARLLKGKPNQSETDAETEAVDIPA